MTDQMPIQHNYPEVDEFARFMKQNLWEKRHKGDQEGWQKVTFTNLLMMLDAEVEELAGALLGGDSKEVAREAADVANFAMMIADNAGGLMGGGE